MTFVVMRGLCRSRRCCLQYATRAEAVAAIEAARWLGHGRGLWVRPARRRA